MRMSNDVVEMVPLAPEEDDTADAETLMEPSAPATGPQYSEDLMVQFGLGDVLEQLRSRKMRSSFSHYIAEMQSEIVPLKPRCPAGSLAKIAFQPINEDERRLEPFDERVLRNALTLKETEQKPPLPDWLETEQPWGDDDRKKRRRDKKKKKKKRKRKRNHDDGNVEGEDGANKGDDDERRAKKKRK